jgi:hypothetical protein
VDKVQWQEAVFQLRPWQIEDDLSAAVRLTSTAAGFSRLHATPVRDVRGGRIRRRDLATAATTEPRRRPARWRSQRPRATVPSARSPIGSAPAWRPGIHRPAFWPCDREGVRFGHPEKMLRFRTLRAGRFQIQARMEPTFDISPVRAASRVSGKACIGTCRGADF